jgi:hypothetical protein
MGEYQRFGIYLAPRLGVPGLSTFWGAFVDCSKFSKTFLLTPPTDLGAGPGAGQPPLALVLR